MTEKKQKKINIYEIAGKAGKGIRKFGGYALAAGFTYVVVNSSEMIKKIKRS